MPTRNSTDWMWAQACELMDRADRLQRQFFRLATAERSQAVWEPPVDVFEDERDIVVVVALPGVPAERVEVTIESGELIVRAERRLPVSLACGAVRRLEIPYGFFERRIRLPEARLEAEVRESIDGCLVLRLHKVA
jgi:HSP20 family protein